VYIYVKPNYTMKTIVLLLAGLCAYVGLYAQLRPTLMSFTPNTGATQVLTTIPLTMTFNKAVTKGSGNIRLRNRTLKTTQTFAATATNVSVSGSFVTISSPGLIAGCYYHVTFDSTAFDSASYHSMGLYDTSTWWFRTAGVGVGVSGIEPSRMEISLAGTPAKGLFVFSCHLPTTGNVNIRVYDLSGREVAGKHYYGMQGPNEWSLQTDLAPGTYIILAASGQLSGSVKTLMQ
jgi:hypothetical protein